METKLHLKRVSRLVAVIFTLVLPGLLVAQNRPKKSNYDNVAWYQLPEGGFYCEDAIMIDDWSWNVSSFPREQYQFYVVPAFSSARFRNLIPNEDYIWSNSYDSNIEDNGDLIISGIQPYDNSSEYMEHWVPEFAPTITDVSMPSEPEGRNYFTCGSWFASYGAISPLCLAPVGPCPPISGGMLSTGYALGTGDGSDGFVQVVTKPASTLYVENISAKVVSKTQPLANGATLTMELCHVGQNDVVGTPFITLKATAANQSAEGQDGDMNIYNLVFRTADGQPFVINERFALKVTDCSEPGVDVGFQVQEKRGEYVCPAVQSLSTSGDAVALDGFNNDMVAYLSINGVLDVVLISAYDGNTNTKSDVYRTPYTTETDLMVILQTAGWYNLMPDDNFRPLGEQRYHPTSLPDWIHYEVDYSLSQWEPFSDPPGRTVFDFQLSALPEGMTGRYCKIYFTGLGVISNPLTIIQGDVTVPDAGDVNYDAVVDVEDVNAVINLILNEAKFMDNPDADVNHDGNIDIADVNALINIILAQ